MSRVKMQVQPLYTPHQWGVGKLAGTAPPIHLLTMWLRLMSLQPKRSFGVLFIDLVQAFDQVPKEILTGLPDHVPEHQGLQWLMGCGFQQHAAQHILDILHHQGPVLLRAGIDPVL
eukprot:3117974-Prorocentrum_lima.AAC.1